MTDSHPAHVHSKSTEPAACRQSAGASCRATHRTRYRAARATSCISSVIALAVLTGCTVIGASDVSPSLSTVARELEEADIIRLQDGFFYLANPFTGLRIIDARNVDQPLLLGRAPLGGRAVELFVRDSFAFVVTAADFLNCAGQTVGFQQTVVDPRVMPDFDGSRLWIVDISDPNAPTVRAALDFDGFVKSTRRVGDVIYAVGQTRAAALSDGSTVLDAAAFVTSINIADPNAAFVVETETLPGHSLDAHVSGDAMFLFGRDSVVFDTSVVTFVDVSDPGGNIVIRDRFRVPGRIKDRSFLDALDNAVRIVTEERIPSVFSTVAALYVFDFSNPDDIQRVARLPLAIDDTVTAVRFDGVRGYVESRGDETTLRVLDLSDPLAPRVGDRLETPGVGTQLHPLGARLVAVGFETSAGIRPALSLYDVADPDDPRLLSRVVVGAQLTFDTRSTATVDEKALRIVESAGLILLPYSTFSRDTGLFTDGLLFVEMSVSGLREQATIDHVGFVRRAGVFDGRTWVLSDRAFQTVDIDNLSSPRSLALLEFIDEQALLDAGLSGCAQAARDLATRISPPCGVLGFAPFFLLLAGLIRAASGSALSKPRRRRR